MGRIVVDFVIRLCFELLEVSSQQGSELENNIRNGVPVEIVTRAPVTV